MNIRRASAHILILALAAVAAGAMYWLSSEFRASGLLGGLQVWLEPVAFGPYLAAVVLGGNVHSPNPLLFGFALLVQFYLVFALLSLLWRRFVQKGA